jgi:subtilisin family serine protease
VAAQDRGQGSHGRAGSPRRRKVRGVNDHEPLPPPGDPQPPPEPAPTATPDAEPTQPRPQAEAGQTESRPNPAGSQHSDGGGQPFPVGPQPGQFRVQYPGPWAPPVQPRRSNVGAIIAASLIGVGIVPVVVGGSVAGWGWEQLVLVGSGDLPWWAWILVALVTGALVAGPAALLAVVPRSPAVRVTGLSWLLAAGAAAAMTALRTIPQVHHELYLALLTLAAGVPALLLQRRRVLLPSRGAAAWLAAAAGLAVALPWLWVGALGGVLETVLAVTAAAAAGWLAAGILDGRFWAAFASSAQGRTPVRLVLLGGTVAGLVLLLLAAGTGQAGSHLAELLVLPPLGYALAALHALSERSAPPAPDNAPAGHSGTYVGWLVAIAALGPLAFTDPQEVTLLLVTNRDVPAWTGIAAACSWGIALLLGVIYGFVLARRNGPIVNRRIGAATAAVLLGAAAVVYAGPGQPGLYGERLFVILKQQADLSALAATGTGPAAREARVAEVYRRLVATAVGSQADLRRDLDRLHLAYTPYYLVNGLEVDGGPEVRAWLSRRDDVDRVLVAQRLRPLTAPPGAAHGGARTPPATPQWNITGIGADRVRTELGVDGRGITVGSSDSGVDGTHPALAGTFRGGDDSWYDPWEGTRTPTDDIGHGTHTLASAVGADNVGVAPGANWTGCVNLDRNLGDPGHYLDCLQFMLAPFPAGGDPFTDGRPARSPQVLTNSWGCPDIEGCDTGALRAATAAFAAAGTFFVAAAGNSGPACGSVEDPPAPYTDVLTVGAVDSRGAIADFSSRGPTPDGSAKPDVVAPGENVLSALPGGGYGRLSGTSMAAPHVAGVVALMWSAEPALVGDLARTRQILLDTAVPVLPTTVVGCGGIANVAGAGRVDAYAAVHAAQTIG